MNYRDQAQYETIVESAINGQRKQAATQIVEYGFDIQTLKECYEKSELDHDTELIWKLASAAELAAEISTKEICSDY